MRFPVSCLVLLLAVFQSRAAWIDGWRARNAAWRGVHVLLGGPAGARELEAALPALAKAGVNVVVAQVDHGYAFERHPEVRDGSPVTRAEARRLAAACHAAGIRLIPQYSCLGHQSWEGTTHPLLARHPEFDETPGQFPGNKGIYCRSWCPRAPGRAAFVRDLLDEIIDGFDADAVHVGMDEVFVIASEHCARCRGADPAVLFGDTVRELHDHVVGRRGLEMLMWADRLLDGKTTGLGEWEAARNGTALAIERIPRDIVLCDWHYEPLSAYPGKPREYGSARWLAAWGFRVWPSTWKNEAAARAFLGEAFAPGDPKVLGPLVTTWGAVRPSGLAEWPPLKAAMAAKP